METIINTILIISAVMMCLVAIGAVITVISYCKGVKKNESKIQADKSR